MGPETGVASQIECTARKRPMVGLCGPGWLGGEQPRGPSRATVIAAKAVIFRNVFIVLFFLCRGLLLFLCVVQVS